MQQVGICSGCRHPLAVPAEFAKLSIVCPRCGKVTHAAKSRRFKALSSGIRYLVVAALLFLVGMGVASAIVDDSPPSRSANRPGRRSSQTPPLFRWDDSAAKDRAAKRKRDSDEAVELLRQIAQQLRQQQEDRTESAGSLTPTLPGELGSQEDGGNFVQPDPNNESPLFDSTQAESPGDDPP